MKKTYYLALAFISIMAFLFAVSVAAQDNFTYNNHPNYLAYKYYYRNFNNDNNFYNYRPYYNRYWWSWK